MNKAVALLLVVWSVAFTAGAATGDVDKDNAAGAPSATPYKQSPPVVTTMVPESGPTIGGTLVAFTGTDFCELATVTFGGVPALTTFAADLEHLYAVAPSAIAAGSVDVTVACGGLTATAPAQFTYVEQPLAVSGNVRDSQTGAPLSLVAVRLFNDNTDTVLSMGMSNDIGEFSLSAPDQTSRLRVEFAKDGYAPGHVRGFTSPIVLIELLTPFDPATPVDFVVRSSANAVMLRWDANTELNLAGYWVYRDNVRLNPALLSEPAYRDDAVVSGQFYSYQVTAVTIVDAIEYESAPTAAVEVMAGRVTVWLPDGSGDPGGSVRMPIALSDIEGINPNSCSIDLGYDSTWVESVDVKPTAMTADMVFDANTTEAGRIVITSDALNNKIIGEGNLFDVYFNLRSDAPLDTLCSTVLFNTVSFYDNALAALPVDYTDTGLLCIGTGHIQGDLNGDRIVDDADVLLALKIAIHDADTLLGLADWQWKVGDMNGDGVIDAADAALIKRLADGLTLNPPPAGSKAFEEKDAVLSALKLDQEIRVEITDQTVNAGSPISVPVNLSNGLGLSGTTLSVSYPPQLDLVSVDAGSLTAEFLSETNEGESNIRIGLCNATALGAGAGSLITLNFQLSEYVEEGTVLAVKIADVKLKGQYGESFDWYAPVLKSSGSLTVQNSMICSSATIIVADVATSNPILNASVKMSPGGTGSVTNNVKGVYVFPCVPPGAYTFSVSAPGYKEASQGLTLSGGGDAQTKFQLTATPGSPTGGCFGNGAATPGAGGCFGAGITTPSNDAPTGDLLAMLLVMALLSIIGARPVSKAWRGVRSSQAESVTPPA